MMRRIKIKLLTQRQKQVLERMAKGYTYKEIASDLSISVQTAKNHGYRILETLMADNRAHAVAIAIRKGLI